MFGDTIHTAVYYTAKILEYGVEKDKQKDEKGFLERF